MPSFEVEFEVYCGTCGSGICHNANGRNSRNRGFPQISVEVCDNCISKAKEDALEALEQKIEELKAEIKDLEKELENVRETC
jgi:predicted RNase H-like nuclease (RuvC/YqgF family)